MCRVLLTVGGSKYEKTVQASVYQHVIDQLVSRMDED